MSRPSTLAVFAQMTRDTFRQARASGVAWILTAITAVCTALCLSADVSGDVVLHDGSEPSFFLPAASPRAASPAGTATLPDPDRARREGVETVGGRFTLAFGAISVPLGRERGDAVRFLELILAWGVAGTLGLLISLIWTAGFVPAFLDPCAASALLAKPVGRGQLLVAKYAAVLAFVASQAVMFVVSTWLALGVRTGVWDAAYWWAVPLLLMQFAAFYAFSVLLAVVTRSGAACALGSLLYWLLSWGINYGRDQAVGQPDHLGLPASALRLVEAAYAICPRPIDAGRLLFEALGAACHFDAPAAFQLLGSGPSSGPYAAILSSLGIAGVLLALAAREFAATDY